MPIELASMFPAEDALASRGPSPLARGLIGSEILKLAADVRTLRGKGAVICDLTVGDFAPSLFPIPELLRDSVKQELDAGQTNYPPAVGTPELREAVRRFYARELGLSYPLESVIVASGARPPIYAAFLALVGPGDTVVYPVPSWNINHYTYLVGAKGVPVYTSAENGFLPTAAELTPHLTGASLLVLNSPLNPTGTLFSKDQIKDIAEAVVAENRRREATSERPLMLLFDQVYWQLTFGDARHYTPVELVPESAKYTVFVDAISKCWAATGLRVGWVVGPPWVMERMQAIIGHIGAWAARAEQRATATALDAPEVLAPFLAGFKAAVQERLVRLRRGILAMKAEGAPVDALEAQGAIYLTAQFKLHGRTIGGKTLTTDDDVRRALLEQAGVAIVPFKAFGSSRDDGWFRLSVGGVTLADIDGALERLRVLVQS